MGQEVGTAALGMSVGPVPLQPGSKRETQKGKWHLFLGGKVSALHPSAGGGVEQLLLCGAGARAGEVAAPHGPGQLLLLPGLSIPRTLHSNFPVVQAEGRRVTHMWLQ